MFIWSGLTDDQINHIYGFVYDPDAAGPGAPLRSSKDSRCCTPSLKTNLGMWTDTDTPEHLRADMHDLLWDMLQRPRTDSRRRIILCPG